MPPNEADAAPEQDDATWRDPAHTSEVTARLRPEDVARLDHAAARRGIGRQEMIAEAIDAFLAREIWSGGFIAPPPPPMEPPGLFPWSSRAFRLRGPKASGR